jgi:hypothetical protein
MSEFNFNSGMMTDVQHHEMIARSELNTMNSPEGRELIMLHVRNRMVERVSEEFIGIKDLINAEVVESLKEKYAELEQLRANMETDIRTKFGNELRPIFFPNGGGDEILKLAARQPVDLNKLVLSTANHIITNNINAETLCKNKSDQLINIMINNVPKYHKLANPGDCGTIQYYIELYEKTYGTTVSKETVTDAMTMVADGKEIILGTVQKKSGGRGRKTIKFLYKN